MDAEIVLIPGPLVGASGFAPTAQRLLDAGLRVHLPDVLTAHGGMPPWDEWGSHLAALISTDEPAYIVGYSASTVLAAELAGRISVRGLIFLDGEIPPASGPVRPGSERLRERVLGLADQDGRLPPWSDWYRTAREQELIGIAALSGNPAAYETFLREQPEVALDWFDRSIDLQDWQHVQAGYIQTSRFFIHSGEDAEGRGWPVVRLDGTHLHPTLEPEETAAAILTLCKKLG